MSVRSAENSDKKTILEFCHNTFSWGDYISNVWHHWISEGKLFVVSENEIPVGMCHASISETANQVWIEGIRVNEKFRKKGFAQKLVNEAELFAQKNSCTIAKMLIESNNHKSLNLAKKLGYHLEQTWNFYSLVPAKNKSNSGIYFANYENKTPNFLFSSKISYLKSWRWLPLDEKNIHSLTKQKRIIYTNKDTINLAILTDSEHFDNTLIITLYIKNENNLNEIFDFIENYAFEKNHKRIQILSQSEIYQVHLGLEKKLEFHLLEKQI